MTYEHDEIMEFIADEIEEMSISLKCRALARELDIMFDSPDPDFEPSDHDGFLVTSLSRWGDRLVPYYQR